MDFIAFIKAAGLKPNKGPAAHTLYEEPHGRWMVTRDGDHVVFQFCIYPEDAADGVPRDYDVWRRCDTPDELRATLDVFRACEVVDWGNRGRDYERKEAAHG